MCIRDRSAVTAACCLIKRDLFSELGGFDENFLNGSEDIDLCVRLNRAGYNHYVVHDSEIDHVKGATAGRKDKNEENLALLISKWGDDIRKNESVQDSLLHARTYLFRPFFKPFCTNIKSYIEAVLILTKLRKISGC